MNYLIGLALFTFGMVIYLLVKIRDYKQKAKAILDPTVKFHLDQFWDDELLNLIILFLSGAAVVAGLPFIIGGAVVKIETSAGGVLYTMPMRAALFPMDFILGFSGNQLVFAVIGKYKKTFFNQIGVDESKDK
jgi:hypothetical protein